MLDIGSPDLSPALSVPYGLVEDAFRRLTGLVRGMRQAELEYPGPAGNVNSTATLLAHLARTDLDYLYCIIGAPVPAELEAEYGPFLAADNNLPPVTGKTAAELLANYRRLLDRVRDYLRTQTEADALRPVQVPWWQERAALRYVLWHMAGHSLFHQGQIRRLQIWYGQR